MILKIFSVYYPIRNVIFFLGEWLLIFISILIASFIKISILDANIFYWQQVLSRIALVTSICICCLYYLDLYDFSKVFNFSELVIRLLHALGLTCFILAFIYYLLPQLIIAEKVFMISLVFVVAFVLSWRLGYNWLLVTQKFTERVLIMGANNVARMIVKEIKHRKDSAFSLIGYLGEKGLLEIPYLGKESNLEKAVRTHHINRLIIALKERRGNLPLKLLIDLKLNGLTIQEAPKFYEQLTGKILIENLNPSHIIFTEGFNIKPLRKRIKRIFDIFLSSIGLILSIPISIVTAVAIKLESPGPVLYRQERVGEKGKTFILYKFRSMRQDAEKDRPTWAQKDDPRVTRVGKFIRKTRIDEIPQMWNVLKGDMSFVGPRPERPYFVEKLKQEIPYYTQRHAVKPGITGWAQIRYPYGASVKDAIEKLKYDLYYIKNFSILFDLAIIFETTKVIFLRKGAR